VGQIGGLNIWTGDISLSLSVLSDLQTYVYNIQLFTLFILSLLDYIALHVPGINSPSSGGEVYLCGKWYEYF
jgi:hypothetical protein